MLNTEFSLDNGLQQAIAYHQAGQLPAAEQLYRAILQNAPHHPDANHNLGVLLLDSQKPDTALAFFKHALETLPTQEQFWFSYIDALVQTDQFNQAQSVLAQGINFGLRGEKVTQLVQLLQLQPTSAQMTAIITLFNNQQPQEAENKARDLIAHFPQHPFGWKALGVILQSQGFLEQALATQQQAVKLATHDADALYNLGITQKALAQVADAEQSYRQAIAIEPRHAQAHNNLGIVLQEQQQFEQAKNHYLQAIAINPHYAEAYNNLGYVLKELGNYAQAEQYYRHAIAINPQYAKAHNNLGCLLKELNRATEAQSHYHQAITLNPAYGDAYNNLGILLQEAGQLADAEQCYRLALQHQPDLAEAYSNLGNILKDLGQFAESEQSYLAALALNPLLMVARHNLLYTYNYSAAYSPEFCLEAARQFGELATAQVTERFTTWQCSTAPTRLRVGLVSGDFCHHAVSFFLENLLAELDSTKIELLAYPTYHKTDEVTARLQPYFVKWQPIFGLSDKAAAQLIHNDALHLLIDLAGHTDKNRLPLFAWKPAPVQVAWLGYFATTGLAEMDVILVDKTGVPEQNQGHFTEKVHYLPETRLCFSAPVEPIAVSTLPALQNGFITFGCFQNLSKVTDAVLAVWGKILAQLPTAKLRFQSKQLSDKQVVSSLYARLAQYGIAANRISTQSTTSRPAYLAAHSEVDMILDTFPYTGGTTTCEALWMGVPTLTLAGETLLARQGASLLAAAGLPDWITENEESYIYQAIAFATHLEKLAHLRGKLREQVLKSPLFDSKRFARHFENTLWQLWHEYQPAGLAVPTQVEIDNLRLYFSQGQFDKAELLARQLILRFPEQGFSYKALGAILQRQHRLTEALTVLEKAVAFLPNDAEAQYNFAVALKEKGDFKQAEQFCRHAIALQADYTPAHYTLGIVLHSQQRLEEATVAFQQAIVLKPEDEDVYNNLGILLKEQQRFAEAENCYRAVLAIKPNYACGWNNLGMIVQHQGRLAEAQSCYRAALAIKTDDPVVYSNLLYLQNFSTQNPIAHLQQARDYGVMIAKKVAQKFSHTKADLIPQTLRVGLVSGDFREHVVSYFLESLLSHLSDTTLELFAYPTHAQTDTTTARLKLYFVAWKPIFALTDADAAQLIYADKLHILLDLAGHTNYNRLPVFAYKPAPIQLTWLGYWATTGLAEMDGILVDEVGVPAKNQAHFTEKVYYLPKTRLCFSAPPEAIAVGSLPALKNGFITFGCFQNLTKLTDAVLQVWSKILARLPTARVRFQAKQLNDTLFAEKFYHRLAQHGIARERVSVYGAMSRVNYLAAHSEVDMILDTFPYPGGTTTCEALWMGIPTLTLAGDTLLARQGASLLSAAGLTEWIAEEEESYLNQAIAFASDVEKLAVLRRSLPEQVLKSALFDGKAFADHFEKTLWQIWQAL